MYTGVSEAIYTQFTIMLLQMCLCVPNMHTFLYF